MTCIAYFDQGGVRYDWQARPLDALRFLTTLPFFFYSRCLVLKLGS